MPYHNIDECPQAPTIERIDKVLERVVIALERIAEHGVMVANHENRLNKHDDDLREVFMRVRVVENRHAKEKGMEHVNGERRKFWNGVKHQVTPYAVSGLLFILWLVDKYDVVQKLVKAWKEMNK